MTPTRPTLFLMCGLPGSGKTTLARQLEHEHSALRLTPDEWLGAIFGPNRVPDDQRDALEALQWGVAVRMLSLGVNVVLDWGLWTRSEREEYRARAEALGARVELRFLDVPLDELCARLRARNADLPPGASTVMTMAM